MCLLSDGPALIELIVCNRARSLKHWLVGCFLTFLWRRRPIGFTYSHTNTNRDRRQACKVYFMRCTCARGWPLWFWLQWSPRAEWMTVGRESETHHTRPTAYYNIIKEKKKKKKENNRLVTVCEVACSSVRAREMTMTTSQPTKPATRMWHLFLFLVSHIFLSVFFFLLFFSLFNSLSFF